MPRGDRLGAERWCGGLGAFSIRRQEGSRQGGGRGLWRLNGRYRHAEAEAPIAVRSPGSERGCRPEMVCRRGAEEGLEAAGVIGDGRWTIASLLAALGTGIEMAAQSRGPAVADGAEYLPLLIAEARSITVQKTIALRAEDVGYLHGRPCHVLSVRLNPWRASFTLERAMLSSGLMTACRCLADRCRYLAVVSRSPWPSST